MLGWDRDTSIDLAKTGSEGYRAGDRLQVAARPELVRIETAHCNPSERKPGTLSRWEYTGCEASEVENEDAEVTPRGASKPAIVNRPGQPLSRMAKDQCRTV